MRFYADADSVPGELLLEDYVPGDCNAQELVYWSRYLHEAYTSFHAEAGVRYWFSVQAELWNLPSWGRLGCDGVEGSNSMFRSEYFGYPDWTDVGAVSGGPWDASQEFICYSPIDIDHQVVDATDQENEPFLVDATISALDFALDPDDVFIEYRTTIPGVWMRVDMQYSGSGHWQATMPGQEQPKEMSYYIHAGNVAGETVMNPPEGRDDPHKFDVAWLVQLFEEGGDGAFIVDPDGDDDAARGIWEYADLDTGYVYGNEPEQDHTTLGSKCWITERGPRDVHDGKTTLQSPAYDLTGATIAKVKYWRWYSNRRVVDGDTLYVQVRNDGGPWLYVENNPEPAQKWLRIEYDLIETYGDDLGEVELRFTVINGAVYQDVEAALDDFVILTDLDNVTYVDGAGVNSGTRLSCKVIPNPFHSGTTINLRTPSTGPVHMTVHDVAGRLVATLVDGIEIGPGEHLIPWDGRTDQGHQLQSGIYFVNLKAGSVGSRRQLVVTK